MHTVSFLNLYLKEGDVNYLKMTIGQAMLSRRPSIVLALYILVSCIRINGAVLVSHICNEVSGNSDQVNLQVTINNASTIFKVYAFQAAAGDTTKSANRITDSACIKTAAESIVYDFTVTTTDASHACGISVATEDGTQIVKFVFRIYAYTDDVNSGDDLSYEAPCRMDALTGSTVSTGQLDTSARGNVVLQRQLIGAYLRVRHKRNNLEVDIAKVGDEVFLSVEFYPELSLGPDLYGSSFTVAFPGIDPVDGTTSSELYILLYPRYAFTTVVTVTTKYGEDKYFLEGGVLEKVPIPSDLMGCSDGKCSDGVAEITDKGVLIETDLPGLEIGVVVCSTETGNADCYTAYPDDILGIDYVTTSMPAENEYSEISIAAQADGTTVTIDIPDHYAHIITLNNTSTDAGGSITISLDRGMVFHLAQTSATADRSNVNGYHITSDAPVSVISANRNFNNGHMATPISPTTKFDTEYVLLPYKENGAVTTFIIQPVQEGRSYWFLSKVSRMVALSSKTKLD
ncbi:uncharacterized protein LOC128555921 [Mercenaria mercenaria]|uniref:uncharacterized protein LOC128555921 n=1 Tax=Mercenaria mercenaria TaxID=6596 RepID=UPI00234F1846|nr:uncharacterized protein LOC128555921 [Mercenaria mercenaria]